MKKFLLLLVILALCSCEKSVTTRDEEPLPSEGAGFSKISFISSTVAPGSTSIKLTVDKDKKITLGRGKCDGIYDLTDTQFEDIVNLTKAAGLDKFEPNNCKYGSSGPVMGSSSYMNYITSEGVVKQLDFDKTCEDVDEDELNNLVSYVNSIASEIEAECKQS